jgi:hypothetical protein
VQGSSQDDLLSELLAEVHAIEAEIGAARDMAVRIDDVRAQVEAACQDAAAVLRTLQAAALTPDEARRVRQAGLVRLQDQRAQLAHAEELRREAADSMARAALRVRALWRVLEHRRPAEKTT